MSWLSTLVLLPLFAGAAVLLGNFERQARRIGLVSGLAVLAIAAYIVTTLVGDATSFQFREFRPLFGGSAVGWHLGLDGWSLLPLLAAAVACAVAVLTADEDVEGASAWALVLAGAAFGAILSLNIVLTLLFLALFVCAVAFAANETAAESVAPDVRMWLGAGATGWLLLLAATVVLGLDTGRDGASASFNYAALLRLRQGLEQETPRFWLVLAGCWAVAGWFPFGGYRTALARRLPGGLASVVFATAPLLGYVCIVRFAIPLFPEAAQAYAPIVVRLAGGAALIAMATAWVRDDFRAQLAQVPAALTALAVGAAFLLDTQAALGGAWLAASGIAAVALAWVLAGWLARAAGQEVDWWVVRRFGGAALFPKALLLLALASLAIVPALPLFPGAFLVWFGGFDAAVDAIRRDNVLDFAWRVVLLGASLVTLAALAGRHLANLLTADPGSDDEEAPVGGLSTREAATASLLAVMLLASGVVPNLLLLRGVRSLDFTYERRLSQKAPVRAPVVEADPASADLP